MPVHHASALFNGAFHQRENLLCRAFVAFQKQGKHFVPSLLVHFFQLPICLVQRFIGVIKAVVLGGGVVVQPVGASIPFGRARHPCRGHKEGQENECGASVHGLGNVSVPKNIG